jgi:hypothetical protein
MIRILTAILQKALTGFSPLGLFASQVKANPASVRKYGTGSDMFADMMNNVGQKTEIKTIVGQWSDSAGLTDNYTEYLRNVKAGMKPEVAAANTWTGRQAAKYGYTEVTPVKTSQGVRFNFTKGVK